MEKKSGDTLKVEQLLGQHTRSDNPNRLQTDEDKEACTVTDNIYTKAQKDPEKSQCVCCVSIATACFNHKRTQGLNIIRLALHVLISCIVILF